MRGPPQSLPQAPFLISLQFPCQCRTSLVFVSQKDPATKDNNRLDGEAEEEAVAVAATQAVFHSVLLFVAP